MKLPAVIILCSLALCGARGADSFGTNNPPTAQPHSADVRVLISGGGSAHDFDKWFNHADAETIKAAGGFLPTYTSDAQQAAEGLRNADVFVFSANHEQFQNNKAFREAFTAFANAGKGLVLVHPATWFNWADWPDYNSTFVGGGARAHDPFGGFTVTVRQPQHPVMRSLPASFTIKDELYQVNLNSGGRVEVLAETSQSAKTGLSHPSVWIVPHSKARIVCIALGHDAAAHEHPAFRQLLQNAVRWAAGSPAGSGSLPASLPAVASQTPAPAGVGGSPASAADLVKAHRNNLVFVSGADGAGSGFVARLNEANFLFTNAHVAAGIKGAGFKSLDGAKVAGGVATIAVGHDIFRMQLGPGGTPFEVMQGVDEKVTIDDEIVVLGNSEGAGVINTIKGKVVGVGPQLVEVDAPFQPGNSGSPIIHLKTGKVIGVATYLTIKKYDAATKEVLKAPVIRRFGYRLDSVKTWQPVNWPAFYAQAAEVQAIETLTGDLDGFLVDLSKNHGRVTSGAHDNPVIKTRIDQWLADKKKRLNPKDAATVDQNFISFLKVACRSDTTAAQPRLTYDYFQRQLGEQQQQRGEIADIFDKIIKDIQKDR